MGPIVIDNQMQLQSIRHFGIDTFQKTNEFLMSVPGHAIADHFAVEHIESRKEGGRTVALIVVRLAGRQPGAQRQQWLCSIQSLNLTLLVYAKDHGFIRRIQIKPNNVLEFLQEMFVPAELEGFNQMRFEVILLPNTLNGHTAQSLRFGHGSSTPVSCVWRRAMKCRFDDGCHSGLRNLRNPAGTGGILFQSGQTQGKKAVAPELDGRTRNLERLSDRFVQRTMGRHLDDPGTLDQTQRQAAPPGPDLQRRPLFRRQHNWARSIHETNYSIVSLKCKAIYGTIH